MITFRQWLNKNLIQPSLFSYWQPLWSFSYSSIFSWSSNCIYAWTHDPWAPNLCIYPAILSTLSFFSFYRKAQWKLSIFFFFFFQLSVCMHLLASLCHQSIYLGIRRETSTSPCILFFQEPINWFFFFTLFFKYFYGKYVVCEGDQHLCVFCVWYVKKVIRGFIRAFRFTPTHPSAPRVAIDRGRVRGPSARA